MDSRLACKSLGLTLATLSRSAPPPLSSGCGRACVLLSHFDLRRRSIRPPGSPALMPPIRLGMLTPSSNTVLEPVTAQIVAGLTDVTVHFSRFRVTEIGLDP